jgi:hypothetical protein
MPESNTPDESKNAQQDNPPISNATQQLTFIGNFIDRYFLKQRPWVQTSTFLVFVALFVYGFTNILTGKYVLKGNLWVHEPASECPQHDGPCSLHAKFYELKWGTQDFVTNSKGEYFVTMGFLEYVGAVATGHHDITFIKDEALICSRSVGIDRMAGEFRDETLSLTPTDASVTLPQFEHNSFSIIPEVYAAATISGMYRLLVEGVRLNPGLSKSDVNLTLLLDGRSVELQDHSASNFPAGEIPVTPEQNLDLGSSFFFSLPGNTLPMHGSVKLTGSASGFLQYFSKYEEEFPLPASQLLGSPFQVQGSKGSTISLRIILSQDVKLFRKSSLMDKKDDVETNLRDQGFLTKWAEPPLGTQTETNTLWTGPDVPFTVVQRLLKVAASEDIGLKKIQYQYHFQSSNNPSEIQFGHSAACKNSPTISAEALQRAIAAPSGDTFKSAIAPYSDCNRTSTLAKKATRTPSR